jgi:hypothetical protein
MENILRNLNEEDMNALKELLSAIARASAQGDRGAAALMLDSVGIEKSKALTRIAEHIRNHSERSPKPLLDR